MRKALLAVLVACSSTPPPAKPKPEPLPVGSEIKSGEPAVPGSPAPETLTADTPRTTTAGNTFIAPAGWKIWVDGSGTILVKIQIHVVFGGDEPFGWVIQGGTGAYAGLAGSGSGVTSENTDVSNVNTYDGFVVRR